MANICSNSLGFSGDAKSVKELYTLIKKQDEKFLEKYFFFEIGEYYGIVGDTLDDLGKNDTGFCVSFTSKWAPPLEEIKTLSASYPTLEFKVEWEEPGCLVFGEASFKKGKGKIVDQLPKEYYADHNEEYADLQQWIEDTSPDEILKDLTEEEGLNGMTEDFYPLSLLQEDVVKKIPDEDLPLIMNLEWDENVMNTIKKRLKHGSHPRQPVEAGAANQNPAA
jgi:hypothetical protein